MISKYIVFAVALLLSLSATSPLVYGATSAFLPAGKIQTNGPRIQSITFSTVSDESQALSDVTHGSPIMSWDLSFDAATWASFPSNAVGSTGAFSFDGIMFNELIPVVNTTAFHQAIANLWNQTNFQDNVLGPAGTAGPALFPCSIFASSCDLSPSLYPVAPNYAAASKLLCQAGLTASPSTSCDGTHFSASTVWTYNGKPFNPAWWWRQSLSRHYFSDWIVPNAAKIGLSFNIVGSGTIAGANTNVYTPSLTAVVKTGVYVPGTPKASCVTFGCPGYNTKPVYNYTYVAQSDQWAMYSYGYSASVDYVGSEYFVNSAYAGANFNPTDTHIPALDAASNLVIYASAAGTAAKDNRVVAHLQLVNLPMFNIYYENALFAAYVTGWSGYAAIPTYGADTAAGAFYTGLNVYQTCYLTSKVGANTCPNGGNWLMGLAAAPDTNGGLNPEKTGTSVYDNDVWGQIYDSPLNIPPTGFTKPETYVNWMTSSFTIKSIGTAKHPFTSGSGAGWFAFQPEICNTCRIIGDAITFNFLPNLYWSDHVPITAYDYNFSMYISDVAVSPSLPDASTPGVGLLTGSTGLMADFVNPSNPLQITLYINSTSVWNIGSTQQPMMPQHIFGDVPASLASVMGVPAHPEFFNLDELATTAGAIDTALNPVAAVTCSGCSAYLSSVKLSAWPAWLNNSANLEVASGPFILVSPTNPTEENNGNGLLVANPTYYRPYWQYYAYNSTDDFSKASVSTVTLKLPVYDWTFSTTACASAPDNVCKVPVTTFTGSVNSWTVVNAAGKTIESGTPSCAAGVCTLSIPTATLAKGFQHVILDVSYNSNGLTRTWYQSYSFYLK